MSGSDLLFSIEYNVIPFLRVLVICEMMRDKTITKSNAAIEFYFDMCMLKPD